MEITYAYSSSRDLTTAAADQSTVDQTPSGSMPTAGRPVKVITLEHPTASSSSWPPPTVSRWRAKLNRMTWTEWIELFLPCYRWIRAYKWKDYFQLDFMAGVTVGIMLVPQVLSRILVLSLSCSRSCSYRCDLTPAFAPAHTRELGD